AVSVSMWTPLPPCRQRPCPSTSPDTEKFPALNSIEALALPIVPLYFLPDRLGLDESGVDPTSTKPGFWKVIVVVTGGTRSIVSNPTARAASLYVSASRLNSPIKLLISRKSLCMMPCVPDATPSDFALAWRRYRLGQKSLVQGLYGASLR